MLARHYPYRGSPQVSGVDYLAIELFDDNGDRYVAFFSSAIGGYAMTKNTDYDEVKSQITPFVDGSTCTIGSRFTVEFNQDSNTQITAKLHVDNSCTLKFTMIGQYDYSQQLNRFTMHYVRMNPPECYRCASCGLFGDFQGYEMQTCEGNTVAYGGYTNAHDERFVFFVSDYCT